MSELLFRTCKIYSFVLAKYMISADGHFCFGWGFWRGREGDNFLFLI